MAAVVPWYQTLLLTACLVLFSASIFTCQFAASLVKRTRRANRANRRRLYERAGVATAEKRNVVAFFHPYCNAGGGGERVLFQALLQHLEQNPRHILVVYTGDVGVKHSLRKPLPNAAPPEIAGGAGNAEPDEILERCKARFAIDLAGHARRRQIVFVPLRSRHLVGDTYWKRLTLLGQSWGSLRMGFEALCEVLPDVYIDSMGYAFTYPLVRLFAPSVRIGAYVHYPTISSDMLRRVSSRVASHTNAADVASSPLRSFAKLSYYRLFAFFYAAALRSADVLVANGSWTAAHLDELTQRRKGTTQIVYPPCDTGSLEGLPLSGRDARLVVSLAQFRPEKEQATQLRLLRATLDKFPHLASSDGAETLKLILMGSSRDASDEARIAGLRALATSLRLDAHVEFLINAPWASVTRTLARASVGLSTMHDEHFGINVVEFMAGGLITLSHASAGPLLDIAVPDAQGSRTGYHARHVDEFAENLGEILSLGEEEAMRIRQRARKRAVETFSAKAFQDAWQQRLWAHLAGAEEATKEKSQ